MIRLPRGKIGIEPIFDPDYTNPNTKLTPKEIEFAKQNGLEIKSIPSDLIKIPDQAKERCDQGIVKYKADDVDWIEIGDYVLFSAYDGTLIAIEDELIIIMGVSGVKAKIEDVPDNTVPGLYFKERWDSNGLETDLEHLVGKDKVDGVLLLLSKYLPYFPATYSDSISLIRQSIPNLKIKTNNKYDSRSA